MGGESRWADRAAARRLRILSSERSGSTLVPFLAACHGRSAVQVYDWMLAKLSPRGILIDKTPAGANAVARLGRSRTLASFSVWPIRHPRGVSDSQVRLKRKLRHRRADRKGALTRLRAAAGDLERQGPR